jgi:ribosomal protein L33
MASKRLTEETRIGFMEKRTLETLQLACEACKAIFYYVNDIDDQLKPKFCPECGRKAQ